MLRIADFNVGSTCTAQITISEAVVERQLAVHFFKFGVVPYPVCLSVDYGKGNVWRIGYFADSLQPTRVWKTNMLPRLVFTDTTLSL